MSLSIISIITFHYIDARSPDANTLNAHTLDRIVNETNVSHDTPQINVGRHPVSVSIAPQIHMVYVANADSGSVSVLDGQNDTKIKDIPIGGSPVSIAVDRDRNKVYVANSNLKNGNISVINGVTNTKIKDIHVGGYAVGHSSIAVNPDTNTIYVANWSGYVSVINGTSYTKIKDIHVGGIPVSIAVDPPRVFVIHGSSVSVINGTSNTKLAKDIVVGRGSHPSMATDTLGGRVFVANFGARSISIITNNPFESAGVVDDNYTKLAKDIHIGEMPRSIAYNPDTDTIYVANSFDGNVSVINGTSYTKLAKDIHIGGSPQSIAVNQDTDTVYVTNYESDGVSIIDGVRNKAVAGVTFDIKPSNSGRIICNAKDAPINQYFYLFSGTTCTATPNKGFEFSSWVENLRHNSTRAIKTSKGSDSLLSPVLDAFDIRPNDTESTFNAQFGSYTANFKALPPPIPPAYWIPLYGVIVSSIVGWSIPSIIGWIKAKRQRGRVSQYIKRINSLSDDGKLDENDIEPLDKLRSDVIDAYAEGEISDQHYKVLNEKISNHKINHPINNLSSSERIETSKTEGSPIKYNKPTKA